MDLTGNMKSVIQPVVRSTGIGTFAGRGGTPTRIYDPVQGWMTLLLDADGKPQIDKDGKYIYVPIETP